jgi:hypothetical protein
MKAFCKVFLFLATFVLCITLLTACKPRATPLSSAIKNDFLQVASVEFNDTLIRSQIVVTVPAREVDYFSYAEMFSVTKDEYDNAEFIDKAIFPLIIYPVSYISIAVDKSNLPAWGAGDTIYYYQYNRSPQYWKMQITDVELRYVSVKMHSNNKIEIKLYDEAVIVYEMQTDYVTTYKDASGNITRIKSNNYDIKYFI